jgi:histidine triad (HIT) family protein
MTSTETSIFTKIINREIPADIVYEDETVIAFLDINPVNLGHSLVVPKKPFQNIFDGDSEALAHMMKVGQKIGLALKASGLADGVNLIMSNGTEANQEVFHAHLHVVPRLKGDGEQFKATHKKYLEGKSRAIATKIVDQLQS